MISYKYNTKIEPIVLVYGDIKSNTLVRVHDQCITSEVFGSKRCDCREQLHLAIKMIQEEGGIIIYLQQEGRGIGITNKIKAYNLQDNGFDTVDSNIQIGFESELREYSCVPFILKHLGIESIKLITNNPFKIEQLKNLGINITEQIPILIEPNIYNINYLETKRKRMNHIL